MPARTSGPGIDCRYLGVIPVYHAVTDLHTCPVSVHERQYFSRKGAKTPTRDFSIPLISISYNFAIFASLRELFFLDGH